MTFALSRRVMMLGMAIALLMPAASAMAQKSDAAASKFIQKMGDIALTQLTDKELSAGEREKRVRDLLRQNFDVDAIGKFALSKHWRTATDAQRKEYLKLFENMIVGTYAQRFGEYSGQQFKVGGTKPINDRDSVVSSQVIQKDGPPLNIEWRVRNANGQFKVLDVFIENVSMAITQRSDFDAVVQRSGIDGLLKTLRDRSK